MDEQRRFTRVPFEAESVLIARDARHPTQVLDVSLRGALVRWPEGLTAPVPRSVTLEIRLLGSEVVIRMTGDVAHEEPHRLGLRCTSIDLPSMTHLRRLLELNLGDADRVERELAAML